MYKRPGIVVIGGFDPSVGAGVIRDCVVLDSTGTASASVITCITFQNEEKVFGVRWLDKSIIENQLLPLESVAFQWAKVGVLNSLEMAVFIFGYLNRRGVRIIWDPVLISTSGFTFFTAIEVVNIRSILPMIDIITPNLEECESIFGTTDVAEIESILKREAPALTVILKCGHSAAAEISDLVITAGGVTVVVSQRIAGSAHGTGCVFATAIAGALSLGMGLPNAVRFGQRQVIKHIQYNGTILKDHD